MPIPLRYSVFQTFQLAVSDRGARRPELQNDAVSDRAQFSCFWQLFCMQLPNKYDERLSKPTVIHPDVTSQNRRSIAAIELRGSRITGGGGEPSAMLGFSGCTLREALRILGMKGFS